MLKYYYLILRFFESVINLILVIGLNIRYIGVNNKYRKNKTGLNTIQIIGNGPSLNDDIQKILSMRNKSEIISVNSFVNSSYYTEIKPDHYVIVDPMFYRESNDDRISALQSNILNSLISNTKWKMNLYVLYSFRKSQFVETIKSINPYIRFVYIKNIPIIGGLESFGTFLMRNKLANPIFQNVLIAALYIAVRLDFNKIMLWGADHSWLENISVLDDNTIVLNDKHIYKQDTNNIHLKEEDKNKRLDQFLLQLASMFSAYHIIQRYAEKKNIMIINKTKGSYIDAFKKI